MTENPKSLVELFTEARSTARAVDYATIHGTNEDKQTARKADDAAVIAFFTATAALKRATK